MFCFYFQQILKKSHIYNKHKHRAKVQSIIFKLKSYLNIIKVKGQSNKMQRQQQLQQFPYSKNSTYQTKNQQQPQIGTQILDTNLPSDLDFDRKAPQDHNISQQSKFNNAIQLSKPYTDSQIEDTVLLQSYTVKGKSNFNVEPKYQMGSLVSNLKEQLFQVKCFDEQNRSSGFRRLWEAVVGYTKRQIAFVEGYFYMFQRRNQEFLVSQSWKLVNLFKIFIDQQESKIRFIFTQDQHTVSKDMGVKDIKHVMVKLLEEMQKFGLKLKGQSSGP